MRNNREIISEIMKVRGITSPEDIEEFLSPKPQRTYDPFLLDGMKAGVELLISMAEEGRRICIYGDYDADGVTSVTVMACGVSRLTDNWFFYIPSRFDEGYGLNRIAIDKIKAKGAELIITVDCGCVSKGEVEYAQSLGISVIVTDHHNIEDTIADCIVIDPKKPEKFFMEEGKEPYPCRELAGCGVAFKFIQALQRTVGFPKSVLTDALDMVAVGTVGDIVPLRGENRTLAKYGIAIANTGRRKTLARFAKAIGIEEITSESISFGIVPHINAAGRMDTAMDAVELFNTEDDAVIDGRTERLIQHNSRRKRTQEEAYESCLSMIEGTENFIVLNVSEMHEGIAGIVAGKLKDRFCRPVIIVTPSEGEGHEGNYLKGTGRSLPKVDIYDILNRNSRLFERFGGHKSACGFLMKTENLEALVEGVNRETERLLAEDEDLFEKQLAVDLVLEPAEVSIDLAKDIMQLAPFGEGNPTPKFRMNNLSIRNLSYMGENRTHARFGVCTAEGGMNRDQGCRAFVNCVLFREAQNLKDILEGGNAVDVIGSLSYQVWKGQERVQFIVEDITERTN